jgi:bifunctional DNase/RNase
MRGKAWRGAGRYVMIEVSIDSVKVSLVSQYRLVVLKEQGAERYLPIWIGPFEAEAITLQMQGVEVPRPLTHDLLKKLITSLGGQVSHIVISDLRQETFFANIVLDVDGKRFEIDSRPSDAINLAVRTSVKIFVDEAVMENAAIMPEDDISGAVSKEEEEKLSAFSDFIDTLDLDDLGKEES